MEIYFLYYILNTMNDSELKTYRLIIKGKSKMLDLDIGLVI